MRVLSLGIATVLFATPYLRKIRALCERVSDVRMLARTQIAVAGNERWRRLSRQELLIKIAGMGVSPVNPSRCYVIARAGPPDERELRVFEVRDFADSPETHIGLCCRPRLRPAAKRVHDVHNHKRGSAWERDAPRIRA